MAEIQIRRALVRAALRNVGADQKIQKAVRNADNQETGHQKHIWRHKAEAVQHQRIDREHDADQAQLRKAVRKHAAAQRGGQSADALHRADPADLPIGQPVGFAQIRNQDARHGRRDRKEKHESEQAINNQASPPGRARLRTRGIFHIQISSQPCTRHKQPRNSFPFYFSAALQNSKREKSVQQGKFCVFGTEKESAGYSALLLPESAQSSMIVTGYFFSTGLGSAAA